MNQAGRPLRGRRCTGSPATRGSPPARRSIRCTAASSPSCSPAPRTCPPSPRSARSITTSATPSPAAIWGRRTTRSSSIRRNRRTTWPRCWRRSMELPDFQRNADLLKAVDGNRLRRQDALDPVIAGLDKLSADRLQPSPFAEAAAGARPLEGAAQGDRSLCRERSAAARATRPAAPSTSCSPAVWWKRACRSCTSASATGTGTARTSSPAGSRFRCSTSAMSALIEDLDERGLLDTTIVLGLGEMGRKPQCGTKAGAGRDHWDYAQFVMAAGGGFRTRLRRRRHRQQSRTGHRCLLQGRKLRPHALSPARHRPRQFVTATNAGR